MSLWDAFTNALSAKLKWPSISISVAFTWTGYRKETMPPDQRWVYFTDEEVKGLVPEYVAKLDLARKDAGFPFVIASGLRTPEKNQSIIGAVSDSSHLTGLATDLVVSNDNEVFLLVKALTSVGITRMGIYLDSNNTPTHVHNDADPNKPQNVIWIKREGQPNSSPVASA